MRAVTLADTLPAVRWRPVWRGVAPKRLSSEFPVDHASRTGWGRTVRPPWYGGHGRRTVGRGAARGRPGRAARPVTPTSVPVPGRGGRAEAVVGWLGRARRRRGRDVAASPTAKPRGRAAERVVGTGSGSREPRRPAGGGLAPLSRQPARKACPPPMRCESATYRQAVPAAPVVSGPRRRGEDGGLGPRPCTVRPCRPRLTSRAVPGRNSRRPPLAAVLDERPRPRPASWWFVAGRVTDRSVDKSTSRRGPRRPCGRWCWCRRRRGVGRAPARTTGVGRWVTIWEP